MTLAVRRIAGAVAAALALGVPTAVPALTSAAAADTGYGARLTSATYLSPELIEVTGEVTCPAGHTWVLQVQTRQRSGSWGAQTTDGTCTGELQTFTIAVSPIQGNSTPFHRGRVTTTLYGGSYLCDAETCNDLNLANNLTRTFVLR